MTTKWRVFVCLRVSVFHWTLIKRSDHRSAARTVYRQSIHVCDFGLSASGPIPVEGTGWGGGEGGELSHYLRRIIASWFTVQTSKSNAEVGWFGFLLIDLLID